MYTHVPMSARAYGGPNDTVPPEEPISQAEANNEQTKPIPDLQVVPFNDTTAQATNTALAATDDAVTSQTPMPMTWLPKETVDQLRVLIVVGVVVAIVIAPLFTPLQGTDVLAQYNFKYLYSVKPMKSFVCPYDLSGVMLEKCKRGCYGPPDGVGQDNVKSLIREVLADATLRPIMLHVLESHVHNKKYSSGAQTRGPAMGVCDCVNDYAMMHAAQSVVPVLFNKKTNYYLQSGREFQHVMKLSHDNAIKTDTVLPLKLLYVMKMLGYTTDNEFAIDIADTQSADTNILQAQDAAKNIWIQIAPTEHAKAKKLIRKIIDFVNPSHWNDLVVLQFNEIATQNPEVFAGLDAAVVPVERDECKSNYTGDHQKFIDASTVFCDRYGLSMTNTIAEGVLHTPTLLYLGILLLFLYLPLNMQHEMDLENFIEKKTDKHKNYNGRFLVGVLVFAIWVMTIIVLFTNWTLVENWQEPIDAVNDSNKKQTSNKLWHLGFLLVTLVVLANVFLNRVTFYFLDVASKLLIWWNCMASDLCMIYGLLFIALWAVCIEFHGNVVLLIVVSITVFVVGVEYHLYRQTALMILQPELVDGQLSKWRVVVSGMNWASSVLFIVMLYVTFQLSDLDEVSYAERGYRVRPKWLFSSLWCAVIFLGVDMMYNLRNHLNKSTRVQPGNTNEENNLIALVRQNHKQKSMVVWFLVFVFGAIMWLLNISNIMNNTAVDVA